MEKTLMFSLKQIIGFLVFVLTLHFLGTFYHWYWTYTWFDIPMHFFGGFWLGMVYFWIDPKIEILNSWFNKLPGWLVNLLFLLSFAALIGVLWEFFEFVVDFLIGDTIRFQGISRDTMGDLFFDLLGGTTVFAIFYGKLNK
ncbi:MAG: hypothetical protein WC461_02240 [Candidatus Paceibacterota bacterium]